MFIVQSGLIRRSLVALSTATVAEAEDDDIDKAISLSLFPSLYLSLTHAQTLWNNKKRSAFLFSVCLPRKFKKRDFNSNTKRPSSSWKPHRHDWEIHKP
jgi:hypothetical protein